MAICMVTCSSAKQTAYSLTQNGNRVNELAFTACLFVCFWFNQESGIVFQSHDFFNYFRSSSIIDPAGDLTSDGTSGVEDFIWSSLVSRGDVMLSDGDVIGTDSLIWKRSAGKQLRLKQLRQFREKWELYFVTSNFDNFLWLVNLNIVTKYVGLNWKWNLVSKFFFWLNI